VALGRSDLPRLTMDGIRGHAWRQLVLAALLMGLSMAIATVLIPPDQDKVAAVAEMPER